MDTDEEKECEKDERFRRYLLNTGRPSLRRIALDESAQEIRRLRKVISGELHKELGEER